ncbi:MAG: hypothetical protein ACJ8AG_20650 [Ktedonobacteraceae bacterium]
MNNSEVARIRQQIELESAAMKLAIYGFATVAQHEFISHKYDAIGKCQQRLETLVGEEEATDITVRTYNRVMDSDEQDVQPFKSVLPSVPLHQLKTPPMIDEAQKVIRRYGCEIVEYADHCIVTFPEGTIREEIFPRMYNARYTITLPDGVQMREMYDRCQEKSLLFLMA